MKWHSITDKEIFAWFSQNNKDIQQKSILFSFQCTSLDCKKVCQENDTPLHLMKGIISLFYGFLFT